MKEIHSQEGDTEMTRWICQWPGCKGNGTDLETREDLVLKMKVTQRNILKF